MATPTTERMRHLAALSARTRALTAIHVRLVALARDHGPIDPVQAAELHALVDAAATPITEDGNRG